MGKFRTLIFLPFSSISIFLTQLKDLITYYIPITKYVYIACIHEIYCDQKFKKYSFLSKSEYFQIGIFSYF